MSLTLQGAFGTVRSLVWTGTTAAPHDFCTPGHPAVAAVYDRFKGGYRPVSFSCLTAVGPGDDLSFTFLVTGAAAASGPVELQLGRWTLPGTGAIRNLPDTGSRYAMPADPPVLHAGFDAGEWFVAVHAPVPVTARLGSRQGGAWPLTVQFAPPALLPYAVVVTYRFRPAGTPPELALADVLGAYAATHAPAFSLTDRRPVGWLALSDHYLCDKVNPNGWVAGKPGPDFAARTAARFAGSVAAVKAKGGQALIVWDLEGASRPNSVYFGDPRCLPQLAPEMDAIADSLFASIRAAGVTPGLLIRDALLQGPLLQHDFVQRTYWNEPERAADLVAKARYAHARWGINWFYVDSWAGTLDTLAALRAAVPTAVFSPEMQTPDASWYRYAVPFCKAGRFRTATPADVRAAVPGAAALLALDGVNDPDRRAQVVAGVHSGDVPLFRAWGGSGWDDWRLLAECQTPPPAPAV